MTNNRIQKTVGTKVSMSIYQQIGKICQEKKITQSEWIRALIYRQLSNDAESYEIYDDVERILKNEEELNKANSDNRFRDITKEIINSSIRQKTVIRYVDRHLASIYIKNRDYFEENEIEEMLKDHLDAFKPRIEEEGEKYVKRWEMRKEKPIKYAKDELERRSDELELEL